MLQARVVVVRGGVVALLAWVMVSAWGPGASAQVDERFNAERFFNRMCASCHGLSGAGATAPSLLGEDALKHPGTQEMFNLIKFGDSTGQMPPFKRALTDPQLRTMVIYVRELREKHEREGAPTPVPFQRGIFTSRHHRFLAKVAVEGLDTPWSMAILPDGRWLVCEKPGALRVVEPDGTLHPEPIAGTPAVNAQGQGGLLEVALHPDYAQPGNGWVYLAFSDEIEHEGQAVTMTKVVRGRIDFDAHRWIDEQVIYQAKPEHYLRTRHHYGTRLAFDGGFVFFPIGERGRQDMAQDLTVPNGKFHRVHDDGRIPDDNPFVNHPEHPDALPTIWTYGNRNPQGAAVHPDTGQLWSTEHGPRGGDELNTIVMGKNYGWPVVTFGMNYDGTPITDQTAAPGMEPPVHHWTPSIAVCGAEFVTGDAFPNWKDDLLVTGLAGQTLRRLRIRPRPGDMGMTPVVAEEEELIRDQGRVRDVHIGPGGEVYVLFNQPDRIVRLVPADAP